ncbi:ArnT family glycosyltransferase [Paraliomyxa miuraensis]|uniref:ArnT family glycosyltransferase n=1 Tax=Paraliomyxa miuraensis TaxID=376150 RepID=UPI00224EA456|nr:hypothetical protein [Paraliomyxa miuraensis]MCX4244483.1 glycosyltransferase family 39 protein [Paraliomyxa miuraensis]
MTPEFPRTIGRYDRLYDGLAVLALLVMTLVALLTWQDYGITWDENYHLDYGEHILAFYGSGFEDQTAVTFRIDYLYGGGFDLSGALFRRLAKPLDRNDAIHLLGTLVGVAGLWGTWRLGRVLGGPRAGLLAALFLGATSVYWGHMANNPKDLPFAVGYVWGMGFLLQAIRTFPRVPRSLAIKLAIAIGLAMSVRIGGMLLVCYLGAAIGVWVLYHGWLRRDAEATYRYGRRLALTGIGVVAGAWVVMLVWWPWALYDPIKRPLAAVRRMSQFMDHHRKMPFAGELVSNFDVDWRYMPHYFGLKMPEFVIVLFVVGTVVGVGLLLHRARRVRCFTDNLVLGTLLFSLWFPWLYAVHKESVLYDGLRHFLFEVPVMVAATAWLANAIIDRVVRRFGTPGAVGAGAVVAVLCADQYATMARLHPHEYVYFNRFIGGVKGAVGQYDTDYYAETYGDAAALLARELWKEHPDEYLNSMYRVAGCGGKQRIMRRLPPNFEYRKGKKGEYDFWLGYTRQNCHLRHSDSPVVATLTRDDAVLNVVRDVRRRITRKTKPSRAKPSKPAPRTPTRTPSSPSGASATAGAADDDATEPKPSMARPGNDAADADDAAPADDAAAVDDEAGPADDASADDPEPAEDSP